MDPFAKRVKSVFVNMKTDVVSALQKIFTYAGRARRREFWTFQLFQYLVLALLFIVTVGLEQACDELGTFFMFFTFGVALIFLLCDLSLLVRRLHDVGLTGFWVWYLLPFGLPIVYVSYALDLDNSCNRVINKITSTGYAWLGWLLAFLFWSTAAPITLLMIYLTAGKRETNEFGPDPKAEIKPAE